MLTIRLKQDGVLRALQTNRTITLLDREDDAYITIMHLLTDTPRPGDTHFENGVPTILTEREEVANQPLAAIQLNTPVDRAVAEQLDDARVICLYDGDTLKVIDCGAILFEWPEKTKGTS